MRLELIKEIFLFFARFPDKAGVKELFSQGESNLALYDEWMQAVDALPEDSIFPEIKHYVFGSNPQAVSERISKINDCYMLVDYGQITSERGNIGNVEDSMAILITVAYPSKKDSNDLMELAAKSEMAMNIMSRLRNYLYNEEKCTPWLKQAMAEHELMPWEAISLMPSTGWTLMVERREADMLKMKDKQRFR